MLNSEKLILVELHKTGSSRLKKFLSDVLGGESSGKLAVYSDELAAQGKPIVGVVCDPLSFYLDQWRAGCAGKGEIYKRLTDDKRWDLMRSRQTNRNAKVAKDATKAEARAALLTWNAEYAKTHWYADANNANAFREWLCSLLAVRGTSILIDHGYQVSPVRKLAGYMTYQYCIKFIRNAENMEHSVNTLDALRALNARDAITTHFVRVESAGEDLPKVLDAVGVSLTEEQRTTAEGFKRRGADTKAVRTFYDDETLALVAEREAIINELFGYGGDVPAGKGKRKDKDKAGGKSKADKPGKKAEGEAGAGPKLSKEEREQKREARAARQAGKQAGGQGDDPAKAAAKAEKKASKKATQLAAQGSAAAAAEAKPAKVKRVKNRPADDDVIDNE